MKLMALVGLAAVAGIAYGGSVPTLAEREDLKDLPARWQGVMENFDVPGLAVGVVKGGKVYAIQAWGQRDPGGAAVDADTKFYIASITKTFTATAIQKLVSEGKIALSDAVVKYLPKFKLSEPADAAPKITIQDLLCHAPGIDCGPAVLLDAYTGEITDDRYFALLAKFGKASGTVDYSNIHYTLLGRVIEVVTGKPWREYLRDEILKPSGMTRTSGFISDRDSNSAIPMRRPGTKWEQISPWKTDETMHAAGGMDSTASDLVRWICLNLNDGKAEGKQVLKPGVAPAMLIERGTMKEPNGSLRIMTGFGDAWNLGTYKGHAIASHGGGYTGASAYVLMLPKDNAGFVVLMNSSGLARGLGDTIAIDLLERLTGEMSGADIYAGTLKQAKTMKERGLPREGVFGRLKAKDFPGDAAAWMGTYTNADFGTLTVLEGRDGVEIRLGNSPLDVSANDGGFAVGRASVMEGSKGEFVMLGGKPNAIGIQDEQVGTVIFSKKH